MGVTKKHFYTDSQIQIATLFKALGHPARISIVEHLLRYDQLNCNDLRFFVPLAQSTISQHLKELHNCGLIGYEVKKNTACFFVNKDALQDIIQYLILLKKQTKTKKFDPLITYFKPYISIHLKNTRGST